MVQIRKRIVNYSVDIVDPYLEPAVTQFSAASSLNAISYDWRDEGSMGMLLSASRDFTVGLGPGTHTLLLTVTNSAGLQSSARGVVVNDGGVHYDVPTPTPTPVWQTLGALAGTTPEPTITASVTIVQQPPYFAGQTLEGRFTITNKGAVSIIFDELVLGGRLNGVSDCSNTGGICSDFTKYYGITLAPGVSYAYTGTFTPAISGTYDFQVFYRVGTQWYWNVPTNAGINNQVFAEVDIRPSEQIKGVIKQFEGLCLNLYNDGVGGCRLVDDAGTAKGNCTIGYGHKVHDGPCNGDTKEQEFLGGVTSQKAEEYFQGDLQQRAVDPVKKVVTMLLTQYQFDALVSFTFNAGEGNLAILVSDTLNVGDIAKFREDLLKWRNGGLLDARRKCELKIFDGDGYSC